MSRFRFSGGVIISTALKMIAITLLLSMTSVMAFTIPSTRFITSTNTNTNRYMSTTDNEQEQINYNAIHVPKSGGTGVKSASEIMSSKQPLSLGAPPPRQPKGGSFITKGGIQIDAIVRPLLYTHGDVNPCDIDEEDCEQYISEFFGSEGEENDSEGEESEYSWGSDGAIERLIDLLDYRKGALLTSSYEFPGRYVLFVEFICLFYIIVCHVFVNLNSLYVPLINNIIQICTMVIRIRRSTTLRNRYRLTLQNISIKQTWTSIITTYIIFHE